MAATPVDRLAGVRAKIEWAKKHINDFEADWDAFARTQPYGFPVETDPQTGDKVYRIEIRRPFPPSVGSAIGDIVHNLRSALDHLAWQLVEANGQTPGRHTAYPTCNTAQAYKSASIQRHVQGIASAPLALIEATQPYQSGYSDFGILSELDNFDKHRLLIVTASKLGSVRRAIRGVARVVTRSLSFHLPPSVRAAVSVLENGDEVGRIPASGAAEYQPEVDFLIGVAFREPQVVQGKSVVPFLAQVAQLVESVVNQFKPFI